MAKRYALWILILVSLLSEKQLPAQCGTMLALQEAAKKDPALLQRLQYENAQALQNYEKRVKEGEINLTAAITISVVFHVVYNTLDENIPTSQLMNQINRLNEDFIAGNADKSKTPPPFLPKIGNCQVQFCIANTDPAGAATTGITRTQSSVVSWSIDDAVKHVVGAEAWDESQYLNIWICSLGDGLLGYARLPNSASAGNDGVVILNSVTGVTSGSYGLGRAAVHNVAHYLGLQHIWGDAYCGNDMIADTPTQQQANYGAPSFPHVTCSNGPNGDMFMNFMDNVDDGAMVMFSAGQATAIQSVLNNQRASLKTSQGCSGVGIPSWSDEKKIRLYPNPSDGEIYINTEPGKPVMFVITDLVGKTIVSGQRWASANGNVQLDLSGQSNGAYFVTVRSGQEIVTKKMILSR